MKTPMSILLSMFILIGLQHNPLRAQCKLILEYDDAGNRIFRGHAGDGPADLSPVMTMLPSNAYGVTNLYFHIRAQEVAGNCAFGEITVILPNDSHLSFSYDNTLTSLGPWQLDNAVWDYDNSFPGFHVWKTSQSLNANASYSFGLEAIFDPMNTTGVTTYTVTILAGSGGEENDLNNIDAETLQFFSN